MFKEWSNIKIYFEKKQAENAARSKELWRTLKLLGLPNNKTPTSNICLKNKNYLSFVFLSIAETFKKYCSSLPENFVLKLSKPSNSFEIESVYNYN